MDILPHSFSAFHSQPKSAKIIYVMDINTCFETTKDFHAVALYSHLVPAAITVLVSIAALRLSRSLLVIAFALFSLSFALWLIGDVIVWTSSNYHIVTFFWAPLDYINIVFYLLGVYFFVVLGLKRDIQLPGKILLGFLVLPAWWITINNFSITGFEHAVCEANNLEFLTKYKFFIEYLSVVFISVFGFFLGRKKGGVEKKQLYTVGIALVLFFSIFCATEFISSTTGVYEINLYSLFILPIFLFVIVYAISDLGILNIKLLGFQILPYILAMLIGSQLLFLEDVVNKFLSGITFALSIGFVWLFLRSGKRELEARKKAEDLAAELEKTNTQLREADRQKDELISIVSHQLATPATSLKWYVEMLLDGDLGALTGEQKEQIRTMETVTSGLSDLIGMLLDVSRVQLGKMKIDKQDLDLKNFFNEILTVIEPKAVEKGVIFEKRVASHLPIAKLDRRYTRMTIENLLSNAVKYTPSGGRVIFEVLLDGQTMKCTVQDTGCGIPKEDQDKIFGKLYRASNVTNTIDGNGLGLFVAKGAIEAQGGKIWFESVVSKGTTFYVELPIA